MTPVSSLRARRLPEILGDSDTSPGGPGPEAATALDCPAICGRDTATMQHWDRAGLYPGS